MQDNGRHFRYLLASLLCLETPLSSLTKTNSGVVELVLSVVTIPLNNLILRNAEAANGVPDADDFDIYCVLKSLKPPLPVVEIIFPVICAFFTIEPLLIDVVDFVEGGRRRLIDHRDVANKACYGSGRVCAPGETEEEDFVTFDVVVG